MNRKRTVSSILLASTILAVTNIFPLTAINYQSNSTALAQSTKSNNNELFYIYKGQRVPLSQQKDAIAVEFKPVTNTRSANPLYLQLEQDLKSDAGTRGGSGSQLQEEPGWKDFGKV
jgi:serine protease